MNSPATQQVLFVDTDRYGRITILYGDRVQRLTRKQFIELLRNVKPTVLVADKPLRISYPQIVLKHQELMSHARKRLGLKKSDENDVKVLKYLYETQPDKFRRYTAVERLVDKYVAALKALEHVKNEFECWREVRNQLIDEVENELGMIINHDIYEHVKRKVREKFRLNFESLPLKLLVQYTAEKLKENPDMSLNQFLKKLKIKPGIPGAGKKSNLHMLISMAAYPLYVRKKNTEVW